MSIQAMAWVLEHEHVTTGAVRLVLLALANHAGWHQGRWECWPSIDQIAHEANVTRRQTVKDAMQELIASGLVARHVNAAPDERIPANYRPNLYVLNLGVQGARETSPAGDTQSVPPREPQGARETSSRGHAKRALGGTRNEPQTVSEPSVQPLPPLPPQGGEGAREVVPLFKGMNTNGSETLPAVAGSTAPPGEHRAAAMLAVGEWRSPEEVASHAEVVQALYATVSVPASDDRRDIAARTRESIAMGEHPGLFLLVLASANTFTARAVGLHRGVVQREMSGTPLVGLGIGPQKKSTAAQRGVEKFKAEQARRRAASKVIDADSEEVPR